MIPQFNTTFRLQNSKANYATHEFPSPTWQKYGKLERDRLYTGVLPTEKSVNTSVMKLDMKPEMRLEHPEIFKEVMLGLKYKFEPYFNTEVNYDPEFTMDSSSSFPFPQITGMKKKQQILEKPWFEEEYVDNPFDKPTWWRAMPKHEFMSIYDITVQGKIRTFLPAPLHLLWWQKAFWGPQDENLKKHQPFGIRYGVDLHNGGCDTLIKNHYRARDMDPIADMNKLVFVESDVAGWDRRFSMMKEVYEIRTHAQKCPVNLLRYRRWVIHNTRKSLILMPNGDVVKKIGASNCSGSGTTTGDNCVGHAIINDYSDAVMALDYPDMTTHTDLYSDDILKSFLDNMWDYLKDGSRFRDIYWEFNMIIKETAFHIQKGPIGMSFLGAKIAQVGNYFLPAYNSERIYAALCLNIENPNKSEDVEASKAYSLMMLAWNDIPLFNAIRDYLLLIFKNCNGTFIDAMRKRGLPSRNEVIYKFWLNVEGSYKIEGGGRVLKEVVQMINSLNTIRNDNDGTICENENYANEGAVLGQKQGQV